MVGEHLRIIDLLTGQIDWAYRRPRLYTGPAAVGPAIDTTLRCTGEDAYTPRGCNESQMFAYACHLILGV
jgi:hypothetical protein